MANLSREIEVLKQRVGELENEMQHHFDRTQVIATVEDGIDVATAVVDSGETVGTLSQVMRVYTRGAGLPEQLTVTVPRVYGVAAVVNSGGTFEYLLRPVKSDGTLITSTDFDLGNVRTVFWDNTEQMFSGGELTAVGWVEDATTGEIIPTILNYFWLRNDNE